MLTEDIAMGTEAFGVASDLQGVVSGYTADDFGPGDTTVRVVYETPECNVGGNPYPTTTGCKAFFSFIMCFSITPKDIPHLLCASGWYFSQAFQISECSVSGS